MYQLVTDHGGSSYGTPMLVDEDGRAYGPADLLPTGETAAEYVERVLADDALASWFLVGGDE